MYGARDRGAQSSSRLGPQGTGQGATKMPRAPSARALPRQAVGLGTRKTAEAIGDLIVNRPAAARGGYRRLSRHGHGCPAAVAIERFG